MSEISSSSFFRKKKVSGVNWLRLTVRLQLFKIMKRRYRTKFNLSYGKYRRGDKRKRAKSWVEIQGYGKYEVNKGDNKCPWEDRIMNRIL